MCVCTALHTTYMCMGGARCVCTAKGVQRARVFREAARVCLCTLLHAHLMHVCSCIGVCVRMGRRCKCSPVHVCLAVDIACAYL